MLLCVYENWKQEKIMGENQLASQNKETWYIYTYTHTYIYIQ